MQTPFSKSPPPHPPLQKPSGKKWQRFAASTAPAAGQESSEGTRAPPQRDRHPGHLGHPPGSCWRQRGWAGRTDTAPGWAPSPAPAVTGTRTCPVLRRSQGGLGARGQPPRAPPATATGTSSRWPRAHGLRVSGVAAPTLPPVNPFCGAGTARGGWHRDAAAAPARAATLLPAVRGWSWGEPAATCPCPTASPRHVPEVPPAPCPTAPPAGGP